MNDVGMQNELAHDLGLLQEECAEVIQIINKIRRFGLYERYPKDPLNNVERLKGEVIDILVTVENLEHKHSLDLGLANVDSERIAKFCNKYEKIYKYKDYSRELGLLEK